jgi:hypothetical protein
MTTTTPETLQSQLIRLTAMVRTQAEINDTLGEYISEMSVEMVRMSRRIDVLEGRTTEIQNPEAFTPINLSVLCTNRIQRRERNSGKPALRIIQGTLGLAE